MQLVVKNASGRAVYRRVAGRVKREVAFGRLLVGPMPPTARQLATVEADSCSS
jgi:hypothetical protein